MAEVNSGSGVWEGVFRRGLEVQSLALGVAGELVLDELGAPGDLGRVESLAPLMRFCFLCS